MALSAAGQAAAAAASTRRVCTSCVVRARLGARVGVEGAPRHARQGPGLERGAETTPEPSPSPTVLPAVPPAVRGSRPARVGSHLPCISPISPLYLPYIPARARGEPNGAERPGAFCSDAFCPGAFLTPASAFHPPFMGGRAADNHWSRGHLLWGLASSGLEGWGWGGRHLQARGHGGAVLRRLQLEGQAVQRAW